MTLAFLYSEVMGYTEACLSELLDRNIKVILVYWDSGKKTPYKLQLKHSNLITMPSSSVTAASLASVLAASEVKGIYVSGWMDRKYLSVSRLLKKAGVKTVGGCDTFWNGSVKHRLATLFGSFWLRSYFSELLVAGAYQFEFARRLGYKPSEISWPEYSCDTDLFSQIYNRNETKVVERVLLFVGRFSEVKGVLPLVNAFTFIKSRNPGNQWKLKLIGNGPQREDIARASSQCRDIIVKDFLQPAELAAEISHLGVFCLPSVIEPWGVAAHEFAVAGYPLVLSSACGSAFHFLKDGYNGFMVDPGDEGSLVRALSNIMDCDDETLRRFGARSRELGMQINTSLWADNLLARFA